MKYILFLEVFFFFSRLFCYFSLKTQFWETHIQSKLIKQTKISTVTDTFTGATLLVFFNFKCKSVSRCFCLCSWFAMKFELRDLVKLSL